MIRKVTLTVCAAALSMLSGYAATSEESETKTVVIQDVKVEISQKYGTGEGLPSADVNRVWCTNDGAVYAETGGGLAVLEGGVWRALGSPPKALSDRVKQEQDAAAAFDLGFRVELRQVALRRGEVAAAAFEGLFLKETDRETKQQYPMDGSRSWAPLDVRGVAFDEEGALWFASPQGVGRLKDGKWTLYTHEEGLPYTDFTSVATGPGGEVYFGSKRGLIRFDGVRWEYRQGPRWLPDDEVRSIAVSLDGNVWVATAKGVGRIERRPMRLAAKARFFEEEIDKYNRRTPYGFVMGARLEVPGDKSKWSNHDSDNDGLWTGMYGAGECFAYAATKDPYHKERAKAAFEALRFLSQVTQGGEHPAPKGFPARSILPTDGPDPNATHYTAEKDARERATSDPLWKIVHPRWPRSEDGKWFWKCDTSSDELDGHYFLYAVYYDLVAETDEEKERVRDVVVAITDHLIEHDYQLVDWDGEPTRWARFGPQLMNRDPMWADERGLNSLSILSYLKVAEHMTGDQKYRDRYRDLIDNHGYAMNTLVPKVQAGPGSGNQSDDEMAFMSFYNLINYEQDPQLRMLYAGTLHRYWLNERPEMNPFFNYVYASVCADGVSPVWWGGFSAKVPQECLEEAAETLVRFPLDRIMWPHKNSHRLDLKRLGTPAMFDSRGRRGYRGNGFVLPIDERSVEYWNHDPWHLDYGGDGRELADGQAFLLPYYMGRYHRFIAEE